MPPGLLPSRFSHDFVKPEARGLFRRISRSSSTLHRAGVLHFRKHIEFRWTPRALTCVLARNGETLKDVPLCRRTAKLANALGVGRVRLNPCSDSCSSPEPTSGLSGDSSSERTSDSDEEEEVMGNTGIYVDE